MSYPTDSYSRGPAPLPNLVGGRVEAAAELGKVQGWTVHERTAAPQSKDQPDGLVVAQQPRAGAVLDAGDVILIDVVRRVPFFTKHGAAVWAGVAAALAVLALVLGILVLTDSSTDGDLDAANARIAELQAQVDAAAGGSEQLVATMQQQLDEANARAAAAEQAQTDLQAQLDQSKKDNEALQAQFDAVSAERDLLLQRVAELQAQIGGIQQQVIATPAFTGQQQVAVEEFVRVNSLQLIVQEVPTSDDPSVERGQVVLQSPAAGTPLVKGSVVAITVFAPPA